MSSDDEFVSDDDSDLGFLSDDAADLSYLSATRPDNYSGLDITKEGPDGPWIRLLRLHPGQYDERLSGALVRRPLYEDAVQYVALSYSWRQGLRADQENDMAMTSLTLQSQAFNISDHLAQALRRLRDIYLPTYIWIDAICINQQDLDERASQVQLMSQIYGQAAHVYVWLGEPNATSLSHIRLWLCHQERPWWSRLWVVQECTFAKLSPIMLVGSHQMLLGDLIKWVSSSHHLKKDSVVEQAVNCLQNLYESWLIHEHTGSAQESLLRRLAQTEGLQCTDFHDRIYALLSLTTEQDASRIQVDYGQDPGEFANNIISSLLGQGDWTYGDSPVVADFLRPLGMHIVLGYEQPTLTAKTMREDYDTRAASVNLLDNHQLVDVFVEDVVDFRGANGSDFDVPNVVDRLLFNWMLGRLALLNPNHGSFQRLCHLFLKEKQHSCERVFEFKTRTGVCGLCYSSQPFGRPVDGS